MGLKASERAQLLLIGAVIVAVAILGTVVLLNIIHVPPDVSAQTDSQSVADVERVNDAVESDLRQLTLMHTSVNETVGPGEPLPYVDPDTFNESVEVYGQNYTELSSTSSAAVTSVEYVDSGSYGVVAHQNETDEFTSSTDGGKVFDSTPSAIPWLYVNITTFGGGLNLQPQGTGVNQIQINSNSVSIGGELECDTTTSWNSVVVDLRDGAGEIRVDGELCTTVDLEVTGDFEFSGLGGAEGMYLISGVGGDDCLESKNCYGNGSGEDFDVNPTFHVVYQDANVAYETTFTAFGGDT